MDKSKVANSHQINSNISPWLTKFAYPLGRRVVLPLFFGNLDISGQENVPRTGPVIIAPTHRSRWDALLVPHATGRGVSGRDLRYMVTVDEMKGIQGWFIRHLGGFPVDPRNPAISSLRHGVELLRKGEMLVIFPEGDIFRGQKVRSLKGGLARIAFQAQNCRTTNLDVKVLPLSINYSHPYPSWGCDAKIDIGSPLSLGDYKSDSSKKNAKMLMSDLESRLKELHETEVAAKYLVVPSAS